MVNFSTQLDQKIQKAVKEIAGDKFTQSTSWFTPTANPKFGDYQISLALSLAKILKTSPLKVAKLICDLSGIEDLCEKLEIVNPGFINLRLKPVVINEQLLRIEQDSRLSVSKVSKPKTIVIDYSGPNIAKEMHVGHLRSTVIGDALANILEFKGHNIIRQNHLGDWGTQFGMLIERLLDSDCGIEQTGEIGNLNELYQKAKQLFDTDKDFARRSRQRVVALQNGDEDTLNAWNAIVSKSKTYFMGIYKSLNVCLDEGDFKGESFYNNMLPTTVDSLSRKGLVQTDRGAKVIYLDKFKGKDNRPFPLIIQKSDEGYPYATSDLAALKYRIDKLQAQRLIYVTDSRQSQHFSMVFEVAKLADWIPKGVRLDHVPFGTILKEDGRPFKTRSGEIIRLTELLSEAVERALSIVEDKNSTLNDFEKRRVAEIVGIGAVKYTDLSADRIKNYVFSWEKMLSMYGNTAPYLQYAYTRARSILHKAEMKTNQPRSRTANSNNIDISHSLERQLAIKLFQFEETLNATSTHLQPHRLCVYLYELATLFNSFYQSCSVLNADTSASYTTRLLLSKLTAKTLKKGLELLGIGVMEKM